MGKQKKAQQTRLGNQECTLGREQAQNNTSPNSLYHDSNNRQTGSESTFRHISELVDAVLPRELVRRQLQ